MKKYVNGKYMEMTEKEIAQLQSEQKKFEAKEKHRPLSFDEVNIILIKKQINSVEIEDSISVRMIDYYPDFSEVIGQEVKQGFKFTYQGKLYKTKQPTLTIQSHYYPQTGTESLYEVINEQYDGDLYDSIPYDGNMSLENGKYYTQNGVTYLCNRDTGIAVYNPLSELVGLYVKVLDTI